MVSDTIAERLRKRSYAAAQRQPQPSLPEPPSPPEYPPLDGLERPGLGRKLHALIQSAPFWIVIAMAVGVLLGASFMYAAAAADMGMSGSSGQAATTSSEEKGASAESAHVHDFAIAYETVHHDAVTHDVEHPAVWADTVAYRTVCNICMEPIDGAVAEHEAETGHAAFTPQVPTPEKALVSEAWTETVVDQAAFDETVATSYVCTGCDEERPIERESR